MCTWKSKPGRSFRVLCGSVQSANFSSILKDFLNMVFFMVSTIIATVKPLLLLAFTGLFAIE